MNGEVVAVPKEPPRAVHLGAELRRINERLDSLSRQVDHLYRRTLAAEELKDELVPVVKDVMAALREKLGEMESEFNSEEVVHLLRKLLSSTPRFIRVLEHLESFESLLDEARPLSRDVVRSTVELLQHAEDRGWFRLARGGIELVDRVAARSNQEDIDRLADNLVLIIETVKRMTQPEMLGMANQALDALEPDGERPPRVTFFGLMRSLRDPEIQRGLGVVLELTRQVARRPAALAREDQATKE